MSEKERLFMENYKKIAIGITSVFCIAVLIIVLVIHSKNTQELTHLLESSVEQQLIATSYAAKAIVDPDKIEQYNSMDDANADIEAYTETLMELRALADTLHVDYIYILKEIDGEYYFVFDTDTEDEEVFITYELSEVHEKAFAGVDSVDIMNVEDMYGSYNTSAIPLRNDAGEIVAVLSVDIEDTFIKASMSGAQRNTIVLIVVLTIVMMALVFIVFWLLRSVQFMQAKLEHMAHYDTVTNLPNRQYLLGMLADISQRQDQKGFALLFIDLDNFKKVNDNAGHDAGDEVLRDIAGYLETSIKDSKSFRMTAGWINVAARVGGDEFIQLISNINTEEEARQAAQQILDGFRNSNLGRYVEKYDIGLSIGVALYPYHTSNYHVLIKYADLAMYHAKNAGKNRYSIYADYMSKENGDELP